MYINMYNMSKRIGWMLNLVASIAQHCTASELTDSPDSAHAYGKMSKWVIARLMKSMM